MPKLLPWFFFIFFGLFAEVLYAQQQDEFESRQRIEQRLTALEKANALPRVKLKGFIQFGATHYHLNDDFKDSDLDQIESGAHFRRLRLDARGASGTGFSYRLQLEFADEKVGYKNIHFNYDLGSAELTLGHTKTPQGHEYMRASSDIHFIERSLVTEAFSAGRQTGLEVRGHFQERMTYHAGVYTDATGARDKTDRTVFYTGARVTGVAYESGPQLVHLGGHFLSSSAEFSPRFRAGPESRVSRIRPVDTQDIEGAHKVNRYGGEALMLFSGWRLGYEYQGATVKEQDASFDGHVIELATSLTGERRDYSKSSGTLKELDPNDSWGDGGFGALELGVRAAWLDLSEKDGGKGQTLAANLAWIPLKDLVFSAEVGQLDLERGQGKADQKIGQYQLRAQVKF